MKLTFHGHSAFLVEADGHRVVIDPFLTGNPTAAVAAHDVKVEAVLLTHGHSDHIADAESIARDNDAVIIAPMEVAGFFGRKGLKIHPMNLGGSFAFPFGVVKLTLAFHSSDIETPDGLVPGGNPCGFLLTMGGKTFYHAGDTALFGDMKLIGDRHAIDVAAFPIGDNFTMGPDDALTAAELVGAKQVIPMHYNTFDLIRQDPLAYATQLQAKGMMPIVMKPGESHEV